MSGPAVMTEDRAAASQAHLEQTRQDIAAWLLAEREAQQRSGSSHPASAGSVPWAARLLLRPTAQSHPWALVGAAALVGAVGAAVVLPRRRQPSLPAAPGGGFWSQLAVPLALAGIARLTRPKQSEPR